MRDDSDCNVGEWVVKRIGREEAIGEGIGIQGYSHQAGCDTRSNGSRETEVEREKRRVRTNNRLERREKSGRVKKGEWVGVGWMASGVVETQGPTGGQLGTG